MQGAATDIEFEIDETKSWYTTKNNRTKRAGGGIGGGVFGGNIGFQECPGLVFANILNF